MYLNITNCTGNTLNGGCDDNICHGSDCSLEEWNMIIKRLQCEHIDELSLNSSCTDLLALSVNCPVNSSTNNNLVAALSAVIGVLCVLLGAAMVGWACTCAVLHKKRSRQNGRSVTSLISYDYHIPYNTYFFSLCILVLQRSVLAETQAILFNKDLTG